MNLKKSILLLLVGITLLPAVSLFAQEEITGRLVVEQGTQGVLEGVLVLNGTEWELRTPQALFEIHLGQLGHDGTSISGLEDGAAASVTGYIYGAHISPITLEADGTEYRFRDEDGSPLWAGTRQGQNVKNEVRPTPPGLGRNRVRS
jgi:hypothetical protein